MGLWKKFLKSSCNWNLKDETVNGDKGDREGFLCQVVMFGLHPMRVGGTGALEKFKQPF